MDSTLATDLLALARQSVKERDRALVSSFLEAYARCLPGELARGVSTPDLLAFLMERLAFLEDDLASEVKVWIGEPSPSLPIAGSGYSAIEVRLPDARFIVKNLRDFLRRQAIRVELAVHPVVGVVVSGDVVTGIDASGERGRPTSHIYLHVTGLSVEHREGLAVQLRESMATMLLVNRDYAACTQRVSEIQAGLRRLADSGIRTAEAQETIELLDWLDDAFIFMGYAYRPVDGGLQDCLGLLSMDTQARLQELALEYATGRAGRSELYDFYRMDYLSPVKAESPLRYAGIGDRDAAGNVIGEHVFVGLLSTRVAKEQNRRIPIVARRMEAVAASLDLRVGSYAFTKAQAILNSIPLEDLFYSTADEIRQELTFIREAETGDRTRASICRRSGSRRIAIVAVLPRTSYSEVLKTRVEARIREFLDSSLFRAYVRESDEDAPVRLHFYVSNYRDGIGDAELQELEQLVAAALATWQERLHGLLLEFHPAHSGGSRHMLPSALSGAEMWAKYRDAFSARYREAQSPEDAHRDIAAIERLDAEGETQVDMSIVVTRDGPRTECRIVSRDNLLLNDIVPILEHMALHASGRLTERILALGDDGVFVNSFEVSGIEGQAIEDIARVDSLRGIVTRVLQKRLDDDDLLALGLLAGLDWRQIELLITYRNYFLQVFVTHTRKSVNGALLRHPECARVAIEYFETRFSTELEDSPAVRDRDLLPPIAGRFGELVDDVQLIQDDSILRRLFDLVRNTLRTSFYKQDREGVISIKVSSRGVDDMPRPRPLYEIFVHGPGMEGIHLRGGKVARGGIRHSDRPDDFRTEVLGLMKTQMTKNSIIVPVGSKGGFITRSTPLDRAERAAEVTRQYEHFIGGLLDVTDNIRGDDLIPSAGVLRYDQDDPYLVVAADKGTAHLSDTANAISHRHEFWLDDAFASGGSEGYDHKELGITARGAWVSVERHFRELGVDIRSESIRVVGVGDMSGDVFGNGMLLNDRIKLIAAFDHRNVFIDPDPDPATSYAERQRLFALPRSAWTDYDTKLLSTGARIYERSAKSIDLSPEARALFGCGKGPLNGPELIRCLLKADVDLLWLGGIGTYIKASTESQLAAGDKANDSVRVDAPEVGARVIGEGANLGLTALGRTEFVLEGGLCNTDAVDNSAGVDCSDHEVNLKILMTQLMSHGIVEGREARNRILDEIEGEVAQDCQQNNYLQTALISMDRIHSLRDVESFLELLDYLETEASLSRRGEFIPADEQLRDFSATGRGIPRNILAVIVAYTKNDLCQRILHSHIPDLPYFQSRLRTYFPERIVALYGDHLRAHRLSREIIATVVANEIVNQGGTTLLDQLRRQSDLALPQLVVRYSICDDLIDGLAIRRRVHALDNVAPAADQYRALIALEGTLRTLVRWWSWNEGSWSLTPQGVEEVRGAFADAARALASEECASDGQHDALLATEAALVGHGFDADLARLVARMPLLGKTFLVVAAAKKAGVTAEAAARVTHEVDQLLHLAQVETVLEDQPPGTLWETRFHHILEREIAMLRARFVEHMLSDGAATGAVQAYALRHAEQCDRIHDSIQSVLQGTGSVRVAVFIILDDLKAMLQHMPSGTQRLTGRTSTARLARLTVPD